MQTRVVIGHSYGTDTATHIVANGHSVDRLVTVDPVGWTRPDFAAVASNSGSWINYSAVGGGNAFANFTATVGDAWNNAPAPHATIHRNINRDHATICAYYCRP